MKKVFKSALSCLLTMCLLLTPFSGVLVFAQAGPAIEFNISMFDSVLPDMPITVTITANGSATLVSCDTRLEGVSISKEASVSFTPAEKSLTYGSYTLVTEATDSNGASTIKTLMFSVADNLNIDFTYAEDESIVPSVDGATASYHEVTPLKYSSGYGMTTDGNVVPGDSILFPASTAIRAQYYGEGLETASKAGIPYQTFDIALNGKTDGEIAVRYTGSTYTGERIALKVYNPTTASWDTLGTFMGSDSVSATVDVATYADNDVVHVMAILDYAINGSNTMIWSTDPQHYTKFEDLYDYYYRVYQYAADEYVAGNAGYIITTGDLVDDRPNSTAAVKQWQVADQAMSYVEEVGMPNGLVSGNHDVGDFKKPDYSEGASTADYSKFFETFPASRYNTKQWYGGSLNNNASHYDLVTIGNIDFIVMYLGYGVEATEETIEWANNVLETYSHRTAIITTHQYLDAATADRSPASRAQLIFDKIVDPNPNVKVILCGHDDGSILNEVEASDGRIVYEILSDYQFVEAEDPSFYENEHYIGSVPHCCGDGYIRLMSVEGTTLSSVTYSPVTGRYNPFGDRESFSIDLNYRQPDRSISCVGFSAYVVGEEIDVSETYTNANAIVITKTTNGVAEEKPAENAAATPNAPYYTHAANEAPTVTYKTDLLKAAGLSDGVVNSGWVAYQNLGLNVDLTKTPYLYYSIDVPADGNFTFALVNNTNYAPWLVFRDATGEGAFLNNGNGNWDSYKNREQYITASETGCVDMRTISTDPNKATWIVNQLTFYNSQAKGVTVNYMFFGSEPIEKDVVETPTGSTVKTYHHVSYIDYPVVPDEIYVYYPVDLAALNKLEEIAADIDLSSYTIESANNLKDALEQSVDVSDDASVSDAYFTLSCAIGALEKIEDVIDESKLVSIHNYDMTPSKWTTSDTTKTALEGTGFKLSRNTKNGWASVNNTNAYNIKANNGKIYLKLDVDADCAWSIHLIANQGNVSGTIVVNHAIDNAFNRIDCDSMNGVYNGVYDITEAFTKFGMDASATISIKQTYLYIVPGDGSPQYADLATNPDTVDYKYVELMTEIAETDEVDTTALQALIDDCEALDETLYTVGSWKKLQAALTVAKNALTNTAYVQADINLEVIKLQTAIGKLKLLADVIPEPEGSLLPADEGNWVEYSVGTTEIYRDENNYTIIQNTNNQWPSVSYTYPAPLTYTVADHQISVDMTVAGNSRVDLMINNTWVNIGKFITGNKMNGDDMLGGTYTVNIPLSDVVSGETAVIKATRVYSIGASTASAVTIRQMQITDYVAPPHVEDVKLDLIPESDEEWTLVTGEGTVTVEDGVLTATNTGEGDLRITLNNAEYFNLEKLNSLHMDFTTDAPFKMAIQVTSTVDGTSQWLNTSSNYPSLFTVENDGAAAGDYDINMEVRDLANSIADKSSCYFQQFIILVRAQGTFTLNVAEMIAHDNFDWDESMTTYGKPATPKNPFYAHAAQQAPEVEHKFDLLEAINYPLHPTVTAWTSISGLNLDIDISKTPYLYYSFAVPEGGNFTFALYNNSNYSPWLTFLDSTAETPFINQGAANWDAYTQREQYATTSQTGCIDMRPLLKNPAVLRWITTQINFYNSTGKNVIISYLFFGSEPIAVEPEFGDIDTDGTFDIADVAMMLDASAGIVDLDETQLAVADTNGDGKFNLNDVVRAFYMINGLIEMPQ